MANKLLSFLGTTKYLEACYFYDNRRVGVCQFIQEALLEFFCKNWNEDDRVIVFLTEESKKKNWYGKKEVSDANFEKGLEERLKEIKSKLGLRVSIKDVEIPEGRSEKELWDIFERISGEIDEGDCIIFDITHSYRYLPMLALVVLNYVRFLKNVKINGIVYGAMEAFGPIDEARKIPPEKRTIPVFDLTLFVGLFDWTVAIERFLETGNARMIRELGIAELTPLLRESEGKRGTSLKKLINSLNSFSEKVSTCRGPELRGVMQSILDSIPNAEKELENLKPFSPLLGKVRERFSRMELRDDVTCGLEVVSWCLEHGLIQQGFTILRETIVNYVIMKKLNGDLREKQNREIAEVMLNSRHEKIPDEILKLWDGIREYRNDINHAGWREKYLPAKKFESKLKDFIERAKVLML